MRLGIFAVLVFWHLQLWAGAAVTYHGRILDSSDQPVENASVTFKIQVRSPGVANCLLYEETRTLDMRNSGGVFVIPIGDGQGARTGLDPGILIESVFSNNTSVDHTGLSCNSDGHYQAAALDARKLVVSFNDGSGSGDQLLPSMDINYVPFSLHAEEASSALKIGSTPASQIMSVSSGAATPLSAANFAELLALVNGTSTAYVKPASVPACASGEVLKGTGGAFVCVTDSSGTDTLAGISCADGKILKRVAGSWACADESGVGTENDPTVQAFAKSAPAAGLIVNGSSKIAPDFGTGAGKVVEGNDSRLSDSRAPNGSATGDLTGTYPAPTVAKIRGVTVDTTAPTTGQILKYDGTKWAAAADAGVVSETDPSVQAFAKNAPGSGLIVSSSQVTADFGTTAGKVAQGNDSRFTDSRAPNGAATGDLSGSYPNPVVKGIRGNAVNASAPLDGQVYKWVNGSSEFQAKYVGFADMKKSDGTLQLPSTCAANETLSWSSVSDVMTCVAINNLDASKITSGTIAYARLPIGTAANTVAAGDDSRFTNARAPTGAAGGELGGTYPNPTVAKLAGVALNVSSLTSGQILKYDGTNWVNAADSGVGSETDPSVQAYAKNAPATGLVVNGSNKIAPDFGTGAGKVVEGNDARLSDNRVASDINGVVSTGILQRTGAGAFSTLGVAAPVTNSAGNLGLAVGTGLTLSSGSLVPDFGTSAGKVAQGSDARFPSATCASGNYNRWNGSAWACDADVSTDSTKVLKSGDTMTGALVLPSNGLTVGTSQLVVSGGNVGIGTASPASALEVAGPITVPSAAGYMIKQNGANSGMYTESNGDVSLFRGGNRGLTVSGIGNIGIGVTSPTQKLEVAGSVKIVDGTQGAGKVLTSDANGVASWAAASSGSGFSNLVTLTSSGTWTVPAGITKIKVIVTGGGGGGSGSSANDGYGGCYGGSQFGAGGAGGTSIAYLTVTPGTGISYSIGAGGAGNASTCGNGTAGGTTTFNSSPVVSATGGARGTGGTYPTSGCGGVGSGGQVNLTGGCGSGYMSPVGGSSLFGGGGRQGVAGQAYGSGGGATAAGAAGVIVIEY